MSSARLPGVICAGAAIVFGIIPLAQSRRKARQLDVNEPAGIDLGLSRDVQVGAANQQVNQFIQTYIESPAAPAARPDGAVIVGEIPQPPLAFQPRDDLVSALVASGPGTVLVHALTGMRGVGKTQIAAAYARSRIDAQWRLVAWINAADPAGVLKIVADSLDQPWQTPTRARDAVRQIIALHDHIASYPGQQEIELGKRLVRLGRWAVRCLNELGDSFSQAISVGSLVVVDSERVLGADHPSTLAAWNELAVAYDAAGRLDEAIPLYERSLADHERVLGADHPYTLQWRNNLAVAYQVAGRVGEAIPLFERTLADRERVLGADHPDTLQSRNNLAAEHDDAGWSTEA